MPRLNEGQFYRTEVPVSSAGREPFKTIPHRGTGSESWWGDSSDTIYEHADADHRSNASLSVKNTGAYGHTEYPPHAVLHEGEVDREGKNWRFMAEDHHGVHTGIRGQQALFKHKSQHATSQVDLMYGTQRGRVAGMTQLGIAANDAMQKGNVLRPSEDLSPYSERIVGKMKAAGAVDPKFEKSFSNNMDFTAEPGPLVDLSEADRVSPAEVQSGRRLVRDTIRNMPKKGRGTQLSMQFGGGDAF